MKRYVVYRRVRKNKTRSIRYATSSIKLSKGPRSRFAKFVVKYSIGKARQASQRNISLRRIFTGQSIYLRKLRIQGRLHFLRSALIECIVAIETSLYFIIAPYLLSLYLNPLNMLQIHVLIRTLLGNSKTRIFVKIRWIVLNQAR